MPLTPPRLAPQTMHLGTKASLALLSLAALSAGCGPASDSSGDSEGESQAQAQEGREIGDGFAGEEAVTYEPLIIPAGAPTVVFLGDSLTAGLHLTPEEAYPAAVQRILAGNASPFHLVNAGVSGDTTRGGLNRLPYLLKNVEPDVVVIELGANDGLRGQALESIDANLREIIDLTRRAGAKPMLLGMNVPTNMGEYATEFNEVYLTIAGDLDVPLITRFLEGVGGVPEMNLKDGMHPSAEGHQRLAENMQAALASLLSRESGIIPPSGR